MQNKKILLVNSSGHSLSALHLAYIAALLDKENIQYDVVDAQENRLLRVFENQIRLVKPDVVAFISNIMNPCLNVQVEQYSIKMIKLLRKVNLNVLVIKDGIAATVLTEEILNARQSDIAIIGESDFTSRDLIMAILGGQSLNSVKGIAFIHEGQLIKTESRPLILDLDALPLPSREKLCSEHFLKEDWHTVVASRGCPFNCAICQPLSGEMLGKIARYRQVSKVVDEISFLVNDYGKGRLRIWSDTFTVNRNWAMDFCDEIKKRNLKFSWRAGTRPDCVDLELAKLMKKAGCDELGFGFEASDGDLRNRLIKKQLKLGAVYDAVRINKKVRISTRLAFIIGLPARSIGQAISNLIGNIKVILCTHPEGILLSNTCPIPGTELYDFCVEENIIASKTKWDSNVANYFSTPLKNVSAIRVGLEYLILIFSWIIANPFSILRLSKSRLIKFSRRVFKK